MSEVAKMIALKMMSGRYAALMMLTVTYCLIIFGCVLLAIKQLLDIEFIKGLISGFAASWVMAWKDYAVRDDRKTQGDKNEKINVGTGGG